MEWDRQPGARVGALQGMDATQTRGEKRERREEKVRASPRMDKKGALSAGTDADYRTEIRGTYPVNDPIVSWGSINITCSPGEGSGPLGGS